MAAGTSTTGAGAIGGSSSAGSAPTTNFVGDAGQNIDAAKYQALAQIAQSGSQSQAGLALAGQQQAASRAQALKDAMAFSAARGGAFNPAVQANTQQTVAAPFDSRMAATNMIASNFKQANDATNNAYGSYFNLAKAGLPVANAALQQTINNDQLTAAQKSITERLTALRDQAALAKLTGTAPLTTSQAMANLGGESNAGATIANASAAGAASAIRNKAAGLPLNTGGQEDSASQATQALGTALDQTLLDKNRDAIQKVIDARDKAASAPPTDAAILNSPNGIRGLQDAQTLLQGKVPGVKANDEVAAIQHLVSRGMDPFVAQRLVTIAANKAIQGANVPPAP